MMCWQEQARRLADRVAGPDSGWHEPVSAIPRHRLVPRWWDDGGDWHWRDGASDPGAWLEAGYADRSLVTAVAGTHADLAGPGTAVSGLPTSSATLPGLVVRMLRHARIRPGCGVLDAGTGSGYSTALLARRFGSAAVTSVDIDPYLTSAARARLEEIGLRPQIITGDATGPLPGSYDRIVSMMAVRPVPPGWLAALRPGGRLVTTVSGTMIIITAVKNSDGTASGQVEWDQAGFMAARSGPACPPAPEDMPAAALRAEGENVRTGRYPVVRVEGSGELQSMLEITAPGIRHRYQESGEACTAWMTHPDGSWARASAPGWRDLPEVHQSGPQRLWDILDDLREYWLARGYFRLRGARARITPDGTVHLSSGPWKAAISGGPGQRPGSWPVTALSPPPVTWMTADHAPDTGPSPSSPGSLSTRAAGQEPGDPPSGLLPVACEWFVARLVQAGRNVRPKNQRPGTPDANADSRLSVAKPSPSASSPPGAQWQRTDCRRPRSRKREQMKHGFTPDQIDTTRPHPARMYDAYLGGKDNYPADREAVAKVIRRAPEIRAIARANRAFLGRAVRYLAAECGIRQFLDIGTGIPTAGNVHEVAAQAAPGTRVLYVDNDPIVHTHASALLTGTGDTGIVLADLRDPDAILGHPVTRELIDFSQPVALLLIAILHFIRDDENPAAILATLRDALPPGSCLALSHVTGDFRGDAAAGVAEVYQNATAGVTLRSHAEVSAFFDGWDLVEPGLVQAPLWRPEGAAPRNLDKLWIYGGVARLAG